ncbi:Mitochondrial tRNAs modification protein [Diatrype stigma]|uniref:Mitochondrial tRNAs modification protein n=1 Tax=Diatrype stigma TaxID=117547 RepID=A0AAN9UR66_9PEZI
MARSSDSSVSTTTATAKTLLTLAIETSCDDTCVAILEKLPFSSGARLHFNEKITSDNREFRGVHPLTSVVSHTANLAPLVEKALRALPLAGKHDEHCRIANGEEGEAKTKTEAGADVLWVDGRPRRKPDFIAVTRGPGMTSNLSTGLNTAKGLAVAWGVPLVGVHHMQAHALTPRLVAALEKGKGGERDDSKAKEEEGEGRADGEEEENDPAFPFLSLLVSGGHTLLVHSRSLTSHAILAQAMNIAIGDMLDKCARVILPAEYLSSPSVSSPSPSSPSDSSSTGSVMYGALLEKFVFPDDITTADHDKYEYVPPARRADEILPFDSGLGWALTPPLSGTTAMAYDFAGFNSQVQRAVEDRPADSSMGVEERRLLGRHAMRLAFEHLVSRLLFALRDLRRQQPRRDGRGNGNEETEEVKTVVVSGGVASNRYLMHILRATLAARGFGSLRVVAPPPALCTDNAAMIAWAGAEMFEAGWRTDMDVLAIRKWPLESESGSDSQGAGGEAGEDGGNGILGVGGWRRIDAGFKSRAMKTHEL